MNEHPSLVTPESKKSTVESLEVVKSEIESLKIKTASLKETASAIEQELQSLDVIGVIADLKAKVDGFVDKYTAVLSKVEANADVEAELLAKARKVLS